MRIEIYNISYFSFSFKLNENKKVQLKKFGLEIGGYKKIFTGEGGLKYFKKKWGLDEKRVENMEGISAPQRNYGLCSIQ